MTVSSGAAAYRMCSDRQGPPAWTSRLRRQFAATAARPIRHCSRRLTGRARQVMAANSRNGAQRTGGRQRRRPGSPAAEVTGGGTSGTGRGPRSCGSALRRRDVQQAGETEEGGLCGETLTGEPVRTGCLVVSAPGQVHGALGSSTVHRGNQCAAISAPRPRSAAGALLLLKHVLKHGCRPAVPNR